MLTENGVWIGAGGAIVVDSDPDAEYEEMILKARAPMLGLAAPKLNPTTAPRAAAGTPETPVEVGQR